MSIQCKAAITDGNGNFNIETIEVFDPDEDEILVKVKAAGLCHTDSDSQHWGRPMVMGHEGAGIVVKTGSNVKNIRENDPVILNWATPCYQCYQCGKGNQHICETNSPVVAGANGYTPGHAELSGTRWNGEPILRSFNLGTFSEYTLVKESAVVRNHSVGMPHTSASIISCGVMTGYGSVINVAKPEPGSSIVVLGAGGVGLSVIQGAKLSGAGRVIAVDINSARLDMAREFGATDLIQADRADQGLLQAAKVVKQLVGDRGADYAFECTAVPELGAAPLAMIRNAGMAVQVSGIEKSIPFDMSLFEWDKIYINPLYGQCRPQIDFPKMIDLYDSGALLLDEMITQTYDLADLHKAFDDLMKGKNAKGVIVFS